jgi:hypothetical protein
MAGLAMFDQKKFNRSNHAHRHRLQPLYQTQEKWAPESPALGS